MIYEFNISTGDITVSGCNSVELQTNSFNKFNVDSVGSAGDFFYDRSIATGQSDIMLSVNGMAYAQEVPSQTQSTNELIFQVKTGDFFVKGTGVLISNSESATLNFTDTNSKNATSQISYNVGSAGTFIATGDLGTSLKDSIDGSLGADTPFSSMDYFLNGQKVYSGLGVGVEDGTLTTPLYDSSSESNGVVTSNNKDNFKYVAYKKRPRTDSVTGLNFDLYGHSFIKGRTNFYINGILQYKSNYIETYTGVTMLRSGVNCVISGEFPKNLDGDNLVLWKKKQYLN